MFYVEKLHDDGVWRVERGPYDTLREAQADYLRLQYGSTGRYRVWCDQLWYYLTQWVKALCLAAIVVALLSPLL